MNGIELHELPVEQIPSVLRQLREQSGTSQAEMAKLMRCVQSTISKLENGRVVDLKVVRRYLASLGFGLRIDFQPKKQ